MYIPGNIRVDIGSWLQVDITKWELVHMFEYLQTPVFKKGVHILLEFLLMNDMSTIQIGLCAGNSSKNLFCYRFKTRKVKWADEMKFLNKVFTGLVEFPVCAEIW